MIIRSNAVTVFMHTNTPSLLIPPSSLYLRSSHLGVLYPSQQPTPLRFQESEKRCILVLPQSNNAEEK